MSAGPELNRGALEAVQEADGPHLFGVRHLSPGGAFHLLRTLEAIQPTLVLVEGPADAYAFIPHLVSSAAQPPVAILAYTEELPVRTMMWPLAEYSPEYQAMKWACALGVEVRFMDLPSDVNLALHEPSAPREADVMPAEQQGDDPPADSSGDTSAPRRNLYEEVAEMAGEPDYDTYWERHFEHNLNPEAYRSAMLAFSRHMRELTEEEERRERSGEFAYNAVREAYMNRCLRQAAAEGHKLSQIVVVCGAYHASALGADAPAMTDDELKQLPRRSSKLALMPYSYYRLSSMSGYGAGNAAPNYFAMMWRAMQEGTLSQLPYHYLAEAARHLRRSGTHRSTAEVIEAVRLAEALASLHGGSAPVLGDLRDAARTLLGQGDLGTVADALVRLDVGTAIGRLPEGVGQTPIQDDFARQLRELKLDKYRTAVATGLTLDLRENRQVSTEEAALLDLRRSRFLHRLAWLDIGFAQHKSSGQQDASWKEEWVLQWTPESEIRLVEAVLLGESVELAAAFKLRQSMEACSSIGEASQLINMASLCGLTAQMETGLSVLQRLAADSRDVTGMAAAAAELAVILGYGSLRRVETGHLGPMMRQLFVRSCLYLPDAAGCSDEAAVAMAQAMGQLDALTREHEEWADGELWAAELRKLSDRDDRNPKLSGLACAILLERSLITAEDAGAEMSRRLSPGIPADLGAGWFEGLSMRNRYALLSRPYLWEQLDAYITGLDEEQFRRALVFLRRAFSTFSHKEKTMAAELLGELWRTDTEQTAEVVTGELGEEEKSMLDSLNDFDFGNF
ncbi:MAG: hypothetical protein K0Q90_950 [Paenibacillaceae bacterium]|jgi:hypothetical protein|nr:hypothetical protein [Paenibacillaceae bacterium]